MLMNQKEFKKLISGQSDLSKMDFTDLCLKNLEIFEKYRIHEYTPVLIGG